MNSLLSPTSFFALTGAAILLCVGGHASAVQMSVKVLPIYQVGNGSGVHLGHVVTASTNYNRLTAGGTYIAQCASSFTLPVTGQQTESASAFLGGLKLTVAIPSPQPAIVNMAGFESVQRGGRIDCTYTWTARAVEGGYTVGGGGIGVPVGQGEQTLGSTQLFSMNKPSLGDGGDRVGCIP
jgi:hypothetical protein